MGTKYILEPDERPLWLEYPRPFLRLVEQNLVDLRPWRVLPAAEALKNASLLKQRYPSRDLFPFAIKQNDDETACWAKGDLHRVVTINPFTDPGWEASAQYGSFWDWFRDAVEETMWWE